MRPAVASSLARHKKFIAHDRDRDGSRRGRKDDRRSLAGRTMGWEFADADDFIRRRTSKKFATESPSATLTGNPGWRDFARPSGSGSQRRSECSAGLLRSESSYRKELAAGPEVRFVYLKGSADEIAVPPAHPTGPFPGQQILASQFADLEEPEGAITVEIKSSPEHIVGEIRKDSA